MNQFGSFADSQSYSPTYLLRLPYLQSAKVEPINSDYDGFKLKFILEPAVARQPANSFTNDVLGAAFLP
jgi:hypothetical protein